MLKRIKSFDEPCATILLILLVSGDLVFILLHGIGFLVPKIRYSMLEVSFEGGYPELYQYIKFYWIVILFIITAIKQKSLNYVAWALFFLYLLLDDSLQLHEHYGSLIAAHISFTPIFGLDSREFGELAVSSTVAIFLFPILLWAYIAGNGMFKKISLDIIFLIIILLFFAVIMDIIVPGIRPIVGWKVVDVLTLMEDGCEMLSVSLILWYIFFRRIRGNQANFICDLIRKK